MYEILAAKTTKMDDFGGLSSQNKILGAKENVLELKDHFIEMGEVCMVFEKMDQTLYDYIKTSKTGLSLSETKEIMRQLINGLIQLNNAGIIHTDLKPENFLIKKSGDKLMVCICDLGIACLKKDVNRYFKLVSQKIIEDYQDLLEDRKVIRYRELMLMQTEDPTSLSDKEQEEIKRLEKQKEVRQYKLLSKTDEVNEFKKLDKIISDNIGTTEYQSIEGIIGAKYTTSTDIWSAACIMFECLTNNYLFDPHSFVDYNLYDDSDSDNSSTSSTSSSSSSSSSHDEKKILIDQMHLWLMTRTLGEIPRYISRQGDFADDFFNPAGNIKSMPQFLKEKSIAYLLEYDYNFSNAEAKEIEQLLLPMLNYDQEKRINAENALKMFE
jgi:serine/threonine protein kinase